MNDEDRFKTALELRNLEISLYWERSNFFLALNTAIAVGYFTVSTQPQTISLAFLGLLSSGFWLLCNLGSKFWQARWEEKLRQVEIEVYPNLHFFGEGYPEIEKQVRANLLRQSRSWMSRLVGRAVLLKPSVSSMVIYLSATFLAAWLLFIAVEVYRLRNG